MDNNNKTLKDFVALIAQGLYSSIRRPVVEVNNFKWKPALLFIVQKNQFRGSLMEDPNLHLLVFLEYCNTLKLNGIIYCKLSFLDASFQARRLNSRTRSLILCKGRMNQCIKLGKD